MDIVVCIKSVPDTTEVHFDPETHTLRRDQVESMINPFDTYAIEEGLRIREAHGGTVTVITMGPPSAEKELREALAMGCDRAILLSASEFAGADTWATAYTLAQAIRKLGSYDLILCGKQAIDGDTGQVGPGVAKQLGIVQLTYVSKVRSLEPDSGRIVVERLLEEGREIVSAPLPALLTVLKDINQPRYPTPRALRRARRADVPVWGPGDLGDIDRERIGLQGSPTRVVEIFAPPTRERKVQWIEGEDPEAIADQLADLLLSDQVV